MSLQYEVDALDALPEAIRGFYVPTDEGNFTVELDGAPGLISALKKERERSRSLEKEIRPLGETPEQRAERIALLSTFETTVEQIKTLAAQDKASMIAELDAMRAPSWTVTNWSASRRSRLNK